MSGKRVVPMSELKKLFTDSGFSDVVTYINSGNVVFRTDMKPPVRIRFVIEESLKERFGFGVKVIVTSLKELRGFLASCAYDQKKLRQGDVVYISLLSTVPERQRVDGMTIYPDEVDEFVVAGKAVYLVAKHGYSRTRYNNAYLERELKVDATTRNINTLSRIAEIGMKLG